MKTSPDKYKQPLLMAALSLLWRQWTLLGVPGHEGADGDDYQIIDPEPLLLLTTELGRFDARLLDEVGNWLRQHGRLINIQRLRGLHQQHSLGNGQVLSAMAATLLENSRLAKWKAIEALSDASPGEEPLFVNPDGTAHPNFGEADPFFKRFGYFRGLQRPRPDATPPQIRRPDLLLVKLRALFGVNARAEILAALLSSRSAHPSALARRTGYLPRSVQDILNEMALSGHVLAARPQGTREKHFSLRPGDWDFLITWSEQRFPSWVDWSLLFSLLQDVILSLYERKPRSPLASALRLREIFDRHFPALSAAGLAGHFSASAHESGARFLEAFLTEVTEFAKSRSPR